MFCFIFLTIQARKTFHKIPLTQFMPILCGHLHRSGLVFSICYYNFLTGVNGSELVKKIEHHMNSPNSRTNLHVSCTDSTLLFKNIKPGLCIIKKIVE